MSDTNRELAQFGIYVQMRSLEFESGADGSPVVRGRLVVNKRMFSVRVLALSSYYDVRFDKKKGIRMGVGFEMHVEAVRGQGDLQMNLGAVALQVNAEGVTATCSATALGGEGLQLQDSVRKLVPASTMFSDEILKNLQDLVTNKLPNIIDGAVDGGTEVEFGPIEVPFEDESDPRRLIYFAFTEAGDGSTFEQACKRAMRKFGPNYDPRPIEYVYQELGAFEYGQEKHAEGKAFKWTDSIHNHVAEFLKGNEGH